MPVAPTTTVLPDLWRRFNVDRFEIVPRLAGASHRFTLNGWRVEVLLPSVPSRAERKKGGFSGDGRMFKTDKISCTSLRSGRPSEYEIHSVDVWVRLKRQIVIPIEALGRVNDSLFSASRREQLRRTMKRPSAIAEDALDRWLRILRWKTVNAAIGQWQHIGNKSGWSAYLYDSATRKRFYSGGHFFVVPGTQPVSKRTWNEVEQALQAGTEAPLWFDMLFEGEHRILVDDLHTGIVCLAIACETIVRRLMTRHLTRPANETVAAHLSQMSIGRVFEQWKDLGFWSPRWQRATDLPRLRRLFQLRNAVMHRGDTRFDSAECRAIATAARRFVVHASPYAQSLA
jgi:hypothetical protein